MKKRPWPLVILALLHILAAPGNLIFNAHLSRMTILGKWQEYMLPEYRWMAVFYFLAPVIAGVCIYICRRWSFWVYVLMLLSMCASSYYGYTVKGGAVSLGLSLSVILLDLFIVFYFFLPAVRAVYFDPRLRWWETQARYKTNIMASWEYANTRDQGEILNFSVGGLFFKSPQQPPDNSQIQIHFDFDGQSYHLNGLAIIHSQQNRMGFGVKFQHNAETTLAVTELIKKFHAAGWMLTDRLPGAEEGLLYWLKKLFTTGKGLVPEVRTRK